jgi:hypothetical protein
MAEIDWLCEIVFLHEILRFHAIRRLILEYHRCQTDGVLSMSQAAGFAGA